MLFRYAFKGAIEGVYLHSRSDGKLFNINRLKAKSKTRTALIRDVITLHLLLTRKDNFNP